MKFERLFAPIKIKNLELKNRVLMPAIDHLYTPDGYATPQFNEYYWRRAEGGVGLVVVGGCRIDECGGTYALMSLESDDFIPGYREFTDGMHARGAKVGVQLFHGGRYAHPSANHDLQPIAPSAVYSGYSRATPREMTKEDIQTVIRRGAEAAARAKKAGFDLVELSCSAGYLVCQFLSPVTNQRTDEYGGPWENRVRFALEYVAAVRAAVGEDYPLIARIAGHDLVPGSCTNEDAVRFAMALEEAGVDMLNVTGGWHESKVPQVTGDLPRGGFDYLAAAVKDAVSIPVAASNRINDPAVAERLLALGCADMVSVGRPHIADPDWCRKAESGAADQIRRCMACNQGCLAKAFFGRPVECLVNGQAGREYEVKDLKAPAEKQRILVVGGGPAGCEFAIRAAQQGHRVTLWEKEARIGGQLRMVAAPPQKKEFLSLIQYYETMLKAAGVDVALEKSADAASVKAGGFDLVVTAMGRGAAPEIPLPNKDGVPVYTAYEILKGDAIAGRNVLVVGGGSVGCETAQYLAHEASLSEGQVYHMLEHQYERPEKVLKMMNSSRRNVAIVDLRKIGLGFEPGTGWPVMKDLKRLGVRQYPFSSTVEISGGQAVLAVKESADSETVQNVSVPCDTVVMAVGARPNDSLFNELAAAGVPVRNIGDSLKVTNVQTAVRAACGLIEEMSVKE